MLKVDDIEVLRSKIQAIWIHPDYAKYTTDKSRLQAIQDVLARKFYKSNGKIEKSFLEQFPSSSISIYQADASVGSVSKLTLNNSVVTPTPCN